MEQISQTFKRAGMPGDFHLAAAAIYERLARFKDRPDAPTLDDILDALRARDDRT